MNNNTSKTIKQEAQEIFNTMSIEEQVGQLFILAFPGKYPSVIFEIIDTYGIGGCYISQDNAETFSEARELSNSLQSQAGKKQNGLPLILGVDQEGAWGVLIPEAIIGPGNLALGISNDTSYTKEMYTIFAQEMSSVGYQTILGPCSDINLDPKNSIIGCRSFGENAESVALHVSAAINALHSQGIVAVAKHFPGHGDTHCDTHRDIPVVDKPMSVLLKQELLPFQAAIDAGVDMIMTAHILFPQIDSKYPATLSKKILTDLLRDTMRFQGLIITDSMNMGAMRKHYSSEDATVMAFLAGADLIMLSEEHYDHNNQYLEKQIASINSIINAVQDGRISYDILRDKVLRILQKKIEMRNLLAIRKNKTSETNNLEYTNEKKTTEQAAARYAVKVLKQNPALFPLSKQQSIAVLNATPKSSYHNIMNIRGIGPNQAEPAFDSFVKAFQKQCTVTSVFSHEAIKQNIQALDVFDVIIAVSEDYPLPGEDFEKEEQQEMLQNVVKLYNDKLIVLGLRSPYELELYPDIKCYISTYSSRTCAAIAAADVLSSMH